MKHSYWIFLGGEHGEVPSDGPVAEGVLQFVAATASDRPRLDRLVRRLSRHRLLGVVVAVPVDHAGGSALTEGDAALLANLVRRESDLPVVALVCDQMLSPCMPALGGPCPAGVHAALDHILHESAEASLAGLSDAGAVLDPEVMILPTMVRDRSAAWRAAVATLEQAAPGVMVSALYIAARPDDPAVLQTIVRQGPGMPRPVPTRGAWRRFAVVSAVAVGLGMAAVGGLWWSVDAATREVVRHAVQLRQAALAPAEGVSLGGLAAVQDVVFVLDGGETRLPFVPSSWSSGVPELLREQVAAALPAVLLDPARRHLERDYAALAATVNSEQVLTPSDARDLLQRLTELRERIDAFHMIGNGSGARQWSMLAAAFGPDGGSLPLAWLDTADGVAAMADALQRYAWTPPSLAPLAETVLTRAEQATGSAGAVRREVRALESRLRSALAVLSGAEGQGEEPMAAAVRDVLDSLKGLRALGGDHAARLAGRRAAIEALSDMRAPTVAAGLLSPVRWDTALARLDTAWTQDRQALVATRVDRLGAMFVGGDGEDRTLRVAPWLKAATTAMMSLMEAGLGDRAPGGIPPLGPLSMAEGPPARAILGKAADRLRNFDAWRAAHAAALPEALQRPVLRFAIVSIALDAAIDATAAYAQRNSEGSGASSRGNAYDAETVRDLREVVQGLSTLAPSIARDITWLIGVRAFRALEGVDAAYERHNIFNLRPVVARWSGHGPVLTGSEWREAEQRSAHLGEGWLRLKAAVDRAAPLLDVLQVPEVAGALEAPPLIDKWSGLKRSTSMGDSALNAFAAFVDRSVAKFGPGACGGAMAIPSEAVVGPGLRREAESLVHDLQGRCSEILRAPLPVPKPQMPGVKPYRLLPW